MFVAAALFSLVSCNKEQVSSEDSMLTINWEAAGATKGAPEGNEGTINTLWVYVFDANGMLDISHECTAAEVTARSCSFSVKTGIKTIYAIANLFGSHLSDANNCTTLSGPQGLQDVVISLSDNSSSSFVMVGHNTKNHQTSTAGEPVPLSMEHPIAKVRLGSVTNSLPGPYGALTVKQVFLCNVVGNQNVAFDADPSEWLNKSGTDGDGSNKAATIGQGDHTAAVAGLTFHSLSQAINISSSFIFNRLMYAMPNANTGDINGYNTTFSPTATVMMVVVSIQGTDYYYPISLRSVGVLAKNTEYTVNLTVKGLGNTLSEGPFNKIVKESLTASISVADWVGTTPYTETI